MLNTKSLRYKINVTVILTLLLVTAIFGTTLAIYESQRRGAAIQQTIVLLGDLTFQYSEQLANEIFATQIMALQASITDIKKRKDLLSITTYDAAGHILASTNSSLPKDLPKELLASLTTVATSTHQKWLGGSVLTFTSPISAYSEKVGFWQIRYSLATLDEQTREIIFIFTALILSIATLIGLLLNSILVRFVLNPVYKLRNAMLHIQGIDKDLDMETGISEQHQSLDKMIRAFDELPDKMIRAFDELPDKLVHSNATGNEISTLAISFRQMLLALKNAYIGIRTDALTGLHNRIKLDEVLQDELQMTKRYQSTFSVILLDIDYFKHVNDTYGHLVGDEVLKTIAALLKSTFRTTDTPGRWGGEEFLVILPRQNRQQAAAIAERLRATIAATTFPNVGRVTASFGIAEHTLEETGESLLREADDALYRAKDRGRNCVEDGATTKN